jgi:hypothetical protein
MRGSAIRHLAGAAAATVAALVWAPAAVAAPGGGKLCNLARGWVESRCDGTKASRVATPARCARARDWLDAHCPSSSKSAVSDERADRNKADMSVARAYGSKAKGSEDYKAAKYAAPRRHHKHARKGRTRVVHVYVERPRRCCYSAPVTYYRTTPYKDQVFFTDFDLRPGTEAAFFRAQDANLH